MLWSWNILQRWVCVLACSATKHCHHFQISQRFSQLVCPQLQGHVSHVTINRGKQALVTEATSTLLLHLGLCSLWIPQTVNQGGYHTGGVVRSMFLQLSNLYCCENPLGMCFVAQWCWVSYWAQTHFQWVLWRKDSVLVKWVCVIKPPDMRNRSCWDSPGWYRFSVTILVAITAVSRSKQSCQPCKFQQQMTSVPLGGSFVPMWEHLAITCWEKEEVVKKKYERH